MSKMPLKTFDLKGKVEPLEAHGGSKSAAGYECVMTLRLTWCCPTLPVDYQVWENKVITHFAHCPLPVYTATRMLSCSPRHIVPEKRDLSLPEHYNLVESSLLGHHKLTIPVSGAPLRHELFKRHAWFELFKRHARGRLHS